MTPSQLRADPPSTQCPWLPLAHLNLRCNPFGELPAAERAAVAVVDVDRWLPWLDADRRAVQFMGDCGRGKTTHLLALQARLRHAAYVYLPEDGPCPPIPAGRPLLIDEAQRLPWRVRRRVLSSSVPLVLGTHVDLMRPLRRSRYQVHTVHVAAGLDAGRLVAILNQRIEAARLADGPLPRIGISDARALIARWGDDIRSMEGFLYERVQQYAGDHRGEVRFVD